MFPSPRETFPIIQKRRREFKRGRCELKRGKRKDVGRVWRDVYGTLPKGMRLVEEGTHVLIKAKSKGETVAKPKMRVVHSAKEDLMSQLKASLNATPAKKKKAS